MSVVRATSPVTRVPTRPALTSAAVVPPTRGVNTSFDSPNVPWHDAHLSSHTFWPFCTLPDPAGSPLKSGRTSMSHALISAGVAGRPTPGNWAAAGVASAIVIAAAARQRWAATQSINLDIRHFPALRHLPRLDRVVVVDRAPAAHLAQLVDLGLHVPGLVDGARLQHRGAAVPHPIDVEAREALREHRRLEACGAPVPAAVDRHIDALHLAASRPGEAGHVVEALVEQHLPARGACHHRLALLDRAVLPVRAVGHEIDVVERLVLCGPG